MLLKDKECAKWTDREIARRGPINNATVSRISPPIGAEDDEDEVAVGGDVLEAAAAGDAAANCRA